MDIHDLSKKIDREDQNENISDADFDFLVSTLEVCFLTTAVILANAAFALAILALIAFFWAPGALRSFALSVATFLAITNYLRSAYFLLGSVAAAILASIFETLF